LTGLAPTRRWRLTGGLALAVGFTMLALWLPDHALTASLPVNTTADVVAADSHCSLREAISAANNDAPVFVGQGECPAGNGADTISLPAGHYVLGGVPNDELNNSGDLDIQGAQPLTIAGAGAATTTIDANGVDRVIDVHLNRSLTLRGITVTGGHSPDGPDGTPANGTSAGQNVQGGFGGSGADGGGILNSGTLTIVDSTIAGNTAGKGGNAGSGHGGDGTTAATGTNGGSGASGNAGNGGNGGGIYTSGNLALTRVNNTAGAGGTGATGTGGQGGGGISGNGGAGGLGRGGDEGDGGDGGGVFEDPFGLLTIDQSVITGNTAGAAGAGGLGQGGVGGPSAGGTAGGAGGAGHGGDAGGSGRGGGVGAVGSLVITRSLIVGNAAGAGAPGGNGTGGGGGARLVAGGAAGNGGDSTGGDGAIGGHGGGVWLATAPSATRTITNSTITGNASGAGGNAGSGTGGQGGGVIDGTSAKGLGGDGTGGHGGGGGSGAGLWTELSPTTLSHATISSNGLGGAGAGGTGVGGAAGGGPGIGFGGNGTGGAGGSPGTGGAVFSSGTVVVPTLTNTIVAANSGPSCDGLITNGGHDIAFADATCPGSNVDPKLLALANNGGPTMTQALGAGSPALDAVPVGGAGCAATDQRGVHRPDGPGCDIGAFERARPGVLTGGATGVSDTGATLTGQVTPNGLNTTYHFEIGPTAAYGTSTPGKDAGADVIPVAAAAAVQGLARTTTYHYRLVGTSANGTTVGADRTFTTGAPGAGDGTAPVFASASLSRKVFAVNRRGRAEVPVTAAKRGTTFRYNLTEASRVLFTIHRVLPGRRVRGKCRRPTATNRPKPRCKRYVSPRRFAAQAVAGANRKKFSGRIGKRALRPGRYRATLVATDAAGNRSKRKRLAFRIVRP